MNGKKKTATGSTDVDTTALQNARRNLEEMLDNLVKTKSLPFSKNTAETIAKIECELKQLKEQFGDADATDSGFSEPIETVSSSRVNIYHNAVLQALNNVVSSIVTNTRDIERLNDIVTSLPNKNSGELAARRMVANIDSSNSPGSISRREREVLIQLLGGKTNRQISRELGISEKTVKNHLWRIYRKLGVENRTQLFNRLIST